MMRPVGDGPVPILYIAPWIDLGGSDKGTIDWFKHVDRERWAPSLITTQPSPNRWFHHVEPYAEEVWDLPDLMPGASFPEFILGFIESRGVRVVHIMNARLGVRPAGRHDLPAGTAGGGRAAARRGTGPGRLRALRDPALQQPRRLLLGHQRAPEGDCRGYEIPPSRVEVDPSGVDAELEFDPERSRAAGPRRRRRRARPLARAVGRAEGSDADPGGARPRPQSAEFVLDIVGDGHLAAPVARPRRGAGRRRGDPLASALAGDAPAGTAAATCC